MTHPQAGVGLTPRLLDVVGNGQAMVAPGLTELVEDCLLLVVEPAHADEIREGECALGVEGVRVEVVLDRGADSIGEIQVDEGGPPARGSEACTPVRPKTLDHPAAELIVAGDVLEGLPILEFEVGFPVVGVAAEIHSPGLGHPAGADRGAKRLRILPFFAAEIAVGPYPVQPEVPGIVLRARSQVRLFFR